MKLKLRTMLTVVVFLAMGSTVVMGQAANTIFSEATRDVYANVTPGLTVAPGGVTSVHVGDVGHVGTLTGSIGFTVHANVQWVDFFVVATALYKADDPNSVYVIPLADPGCTVDPDLGNAVQPADNNLDWTTGSSMGSSTANADGTVTIVQTIPQYLNLMRSCTSEQQQFESGQNNRFSQDVDVIVTWDQVQNELPVGVYSGFVKLVGVL